MTINFTMLAQNSTYDYVKQACLCAMSIKNSNIDSNICLITNDTVPEKYRPLFFDIQPIPWNDSAENQSWKILNRWKIYHAIPFQDTIVLDTDMLVLSSLQHWWTKLKSHKLLFTTNVLTYRHTPVIESVYRNAFVKHNLPDLYSGVFYFQKHEETHEFFRWLELVFNNWEKFQGEFAGGTYFQKTASFDVLAAIVVKILGIESNVLRKNIDYPTFVHMKTHCQNWVKPTSSSWRDIVGVYLNSECKLKIGNYQQSGVFHYTEKEFVTDYIMTRFEKKLGL